MANIFGDYSSWQADSLTYFQEMKKAGSKGAMVKTTDGTNFINPKAGNQIYNCWKTFGLFGCYHFFQGDPKSEAKFFLQSLKKFGADKTTMVALDVESQNLPWYTTSLVNEFLNIVYDAGYHNLAVYGSSSWFNTGRINKDKLVHKAKLWVASYGSSQPGVDDTSAWQFTDNWHGIDQSYDFFGVFTKPQSVDQGPTYWHKGSYFQVKSDEVNLYSDVNFKHWTGDTLKKGSKFHAKAVKVGSIYRLKYSEKNGYITGNTAFIHRIK